VISGNDHIFIDVLEKSFKVSATSFFQVNTEMAAVMVQQVLTTAVFDANSVVMDLYCGVGLFTAFLADRVKKVIAIESSPTACADLEYNLSESENVELYEGDAEDILPHLKEHVDLILVDPPRAGLDKKVTESMLQLSPKMILYVSCDPTTLARDVQRFAAGGYKLVQATPIDMFPQTYHIESISIFAKG
jgi:23S rRNA (uracil1939-C5)-methyltransferase